MSRVISTGVVEIFVVPAIADISAPTTAEITAGDDLTGFVKRDGLSTPQSGSTADISDIGDRFNKNTAGSYGGDNVSVTAYRDDEDGEDSAWDALIPLTEGYLLVSRFGTPEAGSKVEVYPIVVISRSLADTADNEAVSFTTDIAVVDVPDLDAIVA